MVTSRIGFGQVLCVGLIAAVLLVPASAFGWISYEPANTHKRLTQKAFSDPAVAPLADQYLTETHLYEITNATGEPPNDEPHYYHHPHQAEAPYNIPGGFFDGILQNRLYALEPAVYAPYVSSVPGAPNSLWPELDETTKLKYLCHLVGDSSTPCGHSPAGDVFDWGPAELSIEAAVGGWSSYPSISGTAYGSVEYTLPEPIGHIGSIVVDYTGTFPEIWQKHHDGVTYNASMYEDLYWMQGGNPSSEVLSAVGTVGAIQGEMFMRAFLVDYFRSKEYTVADAGSFYFTYSGSSVAFSAANSQDPDSVTWNADATYYNNGGGLVSYDWDVFGNSTFDDAHGVETPNFSYDTLISTLGAGNKTISVRVTDDEGDSDIGYAQLVIATPPTCYWTGNASGSWSNASNWDNGGMPNLYQPMAGQPVVFSSASTGNLNTTDNISGTNGVHVMDSITVWDPPTDVSIAVGGPVGAIQVGFCGINMASATKNLTISAPVYLTDADYPADPSYWSVAAGRTLSTQVVHGYDANHGPTANSPILTKDGAGTLVLGTLDSNDNDYLAVDVQEGLVLLNKASSSSVHAIGGNTFGRGLDIGSAGTVRYTGTGNAQVYNYAPIILSGGTLDFNGHSQVDTTLYVYSGGTIANTAANTSSTYSPLSASVNANFTANAVGNLALAGGFVAPFTCTLTKTGSGDLTLGSGSFDSVDNGSLLLAANAGTTRLNKSGCAAVAGISNINSGALVQYSRGGGNNSINTNGNIYLTGGTFDLNAHNQNGTQLIVTSGSTLANSSTSEATYMFNSIALNAGLYIDTKGTFNLNGPGTISGSGSLTKWGKGFLNVNCNTNSYTGGTTINAGTLKFALSVPNGANSITINSGGALLASGVFSGVQAWINGGRISTSSGGTLAMVGNTTSGVSMGSYNNMYIGATGNYTLSGTITPGNNGYRFGGGGGTLTVSTNLTGSRALYTNGNVILSGTNNYNGGTNINAGNLKFNATASLPTSGAINIGSNGALVANNINGYTSVQSWLNGGKISAASMGALAMTANRTGVNMGSYNNLSIGATGSYVLSGTVTPAGGIYRFGGGGGTLTVTSTLSGSNALVVAGNVDLTGTKTYTGMTYVNSGTLTLRAGSINETSGISISSNGKFLLNSSTPLTKPILMNGGTFGGVGNYTGNLNGQGCLSPGSNSSPISTLTVGGNVSLYYDNILSFDFGTTAGSCDKIQVGGVLTLDGTLDLSYSSVPAGNYTIFSGASSIIDNGLILPDDGYLGHHWSYSIVGNSVVVTAAPEPGTIVLLTIAGLGIITYTWRKRSSRS